MITQRPTVEGCTRALRAFLEDAEEEKLHIISLLKKGYKKDGLDGLKMAAYELEAHGVTKMMLASVLRGVVNTHALDGEKIKSSSQYGFALLGMYADDLKGH